MAWRPHPRGTRTDPTAPRAWGTCDKCGFIVTHETMSWQHDWRGFQLQNLRILACPNGCLDTPQEQLRTIVLPADPPAILNARPEPYSIDEA
jgi:hypothetical protein